MKSLLKLLLICTSISACSSNPTHADRTVLQKLNGNSYEETNSLGIVTELALLRKVEGRIYCGTDITQTPAQMAKVILLKENKSLGSTQSDSTGHFVILERVAKQTDYQLKIQASCGSFLTKILWTEDSLTLNDIILIK